MKIIVLDFCANTAQVASRGCVCRTYGPKFAKADGEVVPLYEYDEKKRVIRNVAEDKVVEDDIGAKKAKQWFLETTLNELEAANGPVWVFFDKPSAMAQIADELEAAVEKLPADEVVGKVKALSTMLKAILKMDDPN